MFFCAMSYERLGFIQLIFTVFFFIMCVRDGVCVCVCVCVLHWTDVCLNLEGERERGGQ